jgi:hypothetical protein
VRTFRLDAHDLDAAPKPGGDARDEPAAADRDEDGVELVEASAFEVLLPLERNRPLARDRFDRIVRMDQERAALRGIGVAALLRHGIGRAADDSLGAIGLDLGDLRARRRFRHEDAGADSELASGEGDRGPVVPA